MKISDRARGVLDWEYDYDQCLKLVNDIKQLEDRFDVVHRDLLEWYQLALRSFVVLDDNHAVHPRRDGLVKTARIIFNSDQEWAEKYVTEKLVELSK